MPRPRSDVEQRNRPYNETHQELIRTAVRIISERGVGSLSIVSLARELGVDRTTVYYHFRSRDDLLAEVKAWSADQLSKAFAVDDTREERIDYTIRYGIENPELIKLWIDDFVSGKDIRAIYPRWDVLLTSMQQQLDEDGIDLDIELFFFNMMMVGIIGPRIYKNSLHPEIDTETLVAKYRDELVRLFISSGVRRR